MHIQVRAVNHAQSGSCVCKCVCVCACALTYKGNLKPVSPLCITAAGFSSHVLRGGGRWGFLKSTKIHWSIRS